MGTPEMLTEPPANSPRTRDVAGIVERTFSVSGVDVVAAWWADESLPTSGKAPGPHVLTLRMREDQDDAALARGITSGVLRQIEREVARTARDWYLADDDAARQGFLSELRERLNPLGTGAVPRKADRAKAYYSALLAAWEFAESNSQTPAKDVAEILQTSTNTLRTRLRTARGTAGQG